MIAKLKFIATLTLIAVLTACGGGGGGGTIYQTTFNATVSGLDSGESITVVASLYADRTITQSKVVSQNGAYSTTIDLPSGLMIAIDSKIEVTQSPTGKRCTVTYPNLDVTSSSNTIKCIPISAAGLYTGQLGSGTGKAQLLILRNGSYWMWTGVDNAGVATYSGLVQSDLGTSTSTNYASNTGVNIGITPFRNNLSLLGTYVANTSFSGTLTDSTSFTLTLTSTPARTYQFLDDPTLTKLTGNYSSTGETFAISSTGALSGSKSGCQYSGTVTPKTSGENVYDLTVTYGGSPCALALRGATLNGVLVLEITAAGTQVIGAAINQAKTSGTFLIATKI